MLDFSDYIVLFLLGSVGAFVAGFLGVGGGIIYIPILDYFLYKIGLRDDVLVKGILANSLFVIIFSGLVSSYKQYRIKNFYPREILYTAIPGLFSAVLMTYLIKTGSWYSKEAFSYVFITMLFIIIFRMFTARSKDAVDSSSPSPGLPLSLTGFLAGFITALSGLGELRIQWCHSFFSYSNWNLQCIECGTRLTRWMAIGFYRYTDRVSDDLGYIFIGTCWRALCSTGQS
jgi:uncharacterized protein